MRIEADQTQKSYLHKFLSLWAVAVGVNLIFSLGANAESNAPLKTFRTLELPISADQVSLLPDNRTVLLASKEARRIFLFDLELGAIESQFDLDDFLFPPDPSDKLSRELVTSNVALDAKGEFAYAAISSLSTAKGSALLRIDLNARDAQTLLLDAALSSPSLSVGPSDTLFVSDLTSSTVITVDASIFEKAGQLPLHRSELGKSIYLTSGASVGLATSKDGKFVFVAHKAGIVSLIDVANAEVVDEIGWIGEKRVNPLTIAAVRISESRQGGRDTALLIGDFREDVLVYAELEPRFGSLLVSAAAPLGLRAISELTDGELEPTPSLIIAAAEEESTIIVGSRNTAQAVVFDRANRTLERRTAMALPTPPLDIDISPNGELITVLSATGHSLLVFDGHSGSWAGSDGYLGSEKIREAQRALFALGYPIGVVDGFDGPRTQRAISIFQRQHDLTITGSADSETLKVLQEELAKKKTIE